MGQNIKTISHRVKQSGIVAIIRGQYPLEKLIPIAEALAKGGVTSLKLTLNSSDALGGIRALVSHFEGKETLVGAGTVRTLADAQAAVEAGASFLVSPNFDAQVSAWSLAQDVLYLPGVFTATEAQTAFAAGHKILKLFPIEPMGPAYLKALRAPLSDVAFMPTGGIDETNLATYLQAGAIGAGLGSSLVKNADQPLADITAKAAVLTGIFKDVTQQTHA